MSWFVIFLLGFGFSFIGSIPPGSINLSVLQYAIQRRQRAGLTFLTAAALTEFIYASIAVKFQLYLSSNEEISQYFQMISGVVLILLGIINLVKKVNETPVLIEPKERRNAFKKGVVLGFSNPLAIPFWLMVTTYLQSMGLLVLSDQSLWIYVAGISTGTFLLLLLVLQIGIKYIQIQKHQFLIYRIPGVLFLLMGIWSFL